MNPKTRYIVDERVGCVAVVDTTLADPDYPGLHADTQGVVWYRHGRMVPQPPCPMCNHTPTPVLSVDPGDIAEAKRVAAALNNTFQMAVSEGNSGMVTRVTRDQLEELHDEK